MNNRQLWTYILLLLLAHLAGGPAAMGRSLREIETMLNNYVGTQNPKLEVGHWSLAPSARWVAFEDCLKPGQIRGGFRHDFIHIFDLERATVVRTVFAYSWSWDTNDDLWYLRSEQRLFKFRAAENETIEIPLAQEIPHKEYYSVIGIGGSSVLLHAKDKEKAGFPGDLFLVNPARQEKIEDCLAAAEVERGWDDIYPLDEEHFALHRQFIEGEFEDAIFIWKIRPFMLVTEAPFPSEYSIHGMIAGREPASAIVVACNYGGRSPVVFSLQKDEELEVLSSPGEGSPCAMKIWEPCEALVEAKIVGDRIEFFFVRRSQDFPRFYYVEGDGVMTCE